MATTTAKKLLLTPTYSKSNSLPASAHDHGSSPFSSPSSTSSSVILFLPHDHPRSLKLNDDDEQEGPPTPPLWSDNNLSDQELSSYRLQEIRKGKMELMEMIKSMPDSSQELSLNYLVNHHHRLSSLMASSRKDEENNRSAESMTMRKKKKGVGWERRRNPYNNPQKQRNSLINGNFFLNMFVPTSCFGGRRQQRSDSKIRGGRGGGGEGIGSGKLNPIRPLFIVDDVEKGKYVDDDQLVAEGWRKKGGVSVVSGGGRFWFGRGGGSNGSSSGSSRNSGFSAGSSSCRSRGSLLGCWSFFLPAKSKSKDV